MRIWVAGRGRVAAAGAALLVLVLFVVTLSLPRLFRGLNHPSAVNREVLFQGAWGGGDGQFGRYQGVDGKVHGPQSLALAPSGWIYVLDTYNRRVNVFDAAGKPLRTLNLPKGNVQGYDLPAFPDDIAVDGKGRIYLADNRNLAILVFDAEGKPLGILADAPPEEIKGNGKADYYGRLENLYAAADGLYADELWLNREKALRLIRRYPAPAGTVPAATVAQTVIQATFSMGPKGPILTGGAAGFTSSAIDGDRFYLEGPVSDATPSNRAVTVTDKDGQRRRVVTVAGSQSLSGAALLGVARDGRLYFGSGLTRGEGQLIIAEATGHVERNYTVAGANFETAHPARPRSDGDVYLLAGTAEGVQLVRLAIQKNLRFSGKSSDVEGP